MSEEREEEGEVISDAEVTEDDEENRKGYCIVSSFTPPECVQVCVRTTSCRR